MYELIIKPEADKIFRKTDHNIMLSIHKKIFSIRLNPYHKYKFLRKPLHSFNRAHIEKHFVLIFRINHDEKSVEIYFFGHHDNVYKWRP